MEHRLPRITFLILLAFAGAACGPVEPQRADTPAISEQSWPASKQSDRGHFTVTVEPATGVIERGKHFSLNLILQPEEDSSPPQVSVDADMPAHRHGMHTKPELTQTGDLSYRVDGMLFHMAGDWVITIDITRDTETDQVAFPISVK